MAHTLFRASAPGTLMLLGEHAVLQNKQALVVSIDKRITILLKPRSDRQIIIHSALGEFITSLDTLQVKKPFQFVLATILRFRDQLKHGFELKIDSEFTENLGLGSSAAITVATLAVMSQYTRNGEEVDKLKLFEGAKSIIQEVQGVGSGADVAASVYGGIIYYQQFPPYILKQLSCLIPLVVIYSGSKTPTVDVIQQVEVARSKRPQLFEQLYGSIGSCVREAIAAIEKKDWEELGSLMKIQQGLMNAIGVSTPLLNQLTDLLNETPGIFGSKISGSGLGDCVIGVGASNHSSIHPEEISVRVSLQGVQHE